MFWTYNLLTSKWVSGAHSKISSCSDHQHNSPDLHSLQRYKKLCNPLYGNNQNILVCCLSASLVWENSPHWQAPLKAG